MDKYPYEVMEKPDSIPKDTDSIARMFSKSPERNFSRHMKLPFHQLAKVLIEMEGNSLSHEMLNCFHFSRYTPTASALVRQRAKLLQEAMAFVFPEVIKAFPCQKVLDGYRLIACDDSDLHYPANPIELDTFFSSQRADTRLSSLQDSPCSDAFTRFSHNPHAVFHPDGNNDHQQ